MRPEVPPPDERRDPEFRLIRNGVGIFQNRLHGKLVVIICIYPSGVDCPVFCLCVFF